MANKKPLKLSETHACAQQFESGDTIAAAFIENGVPTGGTAGQVLAKIDGTNYNTEWVDQTGGGGGASYLVYTALLTQSGTDAPVATVLENTLGGTVVWTYYAPGVYLGTLSGAFTADKTWFTNPYADSFCGQGGGQGNQVFITRDSDSQFSVTTSDTQEGLGSYPIEIRVYP